MQLVRILIGFGSYNWLGLDGSMYFIGSMGIIHKQVEMECDQF
jgi:hypothetical protein